MSDDLLALIDEACNARSKGWRELERAGNADAMARYFDERYGAALLKAGGKLPSKSTRERHLERFKSFQAFCTEYNVSALPAGGGVIASYLLHLGLLQKLPLFEVRAAAAAIRFMHHHGQQFFDKPYVQVALAIILRVRGGGGGAETPKPNGNGKDLTNAENPHASAAASALN